MERIVEHAPEAFSTPQLRLFVELLLNVSPYGLFGEAAEHFAVNSENQDKTEDELLFEALKSCPDSELTGFTLRLLLTAHIASPREGQPDWLETAKTMFAPPKPAAVRSKRAPKPVAAKSPKAKATTRKKAA